MFLKPTDQVRIKLISQLIKGISRVLQKLLKYFSGTALLTSFVLAASDVLYANFALNLNDSESAIIAFGSSILYCYKFPDHFK